MPETLHADVALGLRLARQPAATNEPLTMKVPRA